MKKVKLHGKIGKEFGEEWDLEVDSAVEALRAIEANTGRFFHYLSHNKNENKTFSFVVDNGEHKINNKEDLVTKIPKKYKELHIIPNAEGAFQAFIIPLVVSLATGFIMRSLFKPPKQEEEKQTRSFLFSGPENVAQQGLPVPLGYGRLLTGSIVVSATMKHVDRQNVDYSALNQSDVSTTIGSFMLRNWGQKHGDPRNLAAARNFFGGGDNVKIDPSGPFSIFNRVDNSSDAENPSD